jgi:uncharacterized protein YecT (DUF1311 family)
MRFLRTSFREGNVPCILAFAALFLAAGGILGSNAAGHEFGSAQEGASLQQPREPQSQEPQTQEPQAPVSQYDKAIFQKPIASDQLTFLNNFAGRASNDVVRDGKYRKLIHTVVPDTPFHYGTDMPLSDAIENVLSGPPLPVGIRDGRYVMVSSRGGPDVRGRGFMWIDMQDGIALGGIFYHPTNGEPTPTLTVFSKQVKEESLEMSQLPSAFGQDVSQWSATANIPSVTTRYFINAAGEKIVLAHDEDFCAHAKGEPAPAEDVCEQMNADAADVDMEAAYFLEHTNYASNATARMTIETDQIDWIKLREESCKSGPDRLKCRIHMTHERTHVLINRRRAAAPPSHPHK